MDLFARITKIDERTRTVTGRAAQEILDRSGEIMDYKQSKPWFQKWSAECFADSGGRSHGNVREMHGNVAAGKLTSIAFNDFESAIDIEAQIVDDQSWEKVISGVFTGFSIGGSYQNKTQEVMNGKMVTRYVAAPSEVSLVDRPCVPSAVFDVTKRDGSTVRRRFAKSGCGNLVASMNRVQKLLQENGMAKGNDIAAIRKMHARGGRRMAADFLHKFEQDEALDGNGTVEAIRKAHGRPRAISRYGNRPVDMSALEKMIRRGRHLRKGVTFPRQDNDITDLIGIADTGASNNWHDQNSNGDTPKPTRIGDQVIGTPDQSEMDAAVDAIKQDWARGAKSILQ